MSCCEIEDFLSFCKETEKRSEKDEDVVYFGGNLFWTLSSLKYQCKTSTIIKHNKLQSPLYATVPLWIYIWHNHIHPSNITSHCVLCWSQLGENNRHKLRTYTSQLMSLIFISRWPYWNQAGCARHVSTIHIPIKIVIFRNLGSLAVSLQPWLFPSRT